MAKFYVESGNLRVVVEAATPIPAAAKALAWVTDRDRLEPFVVVNERGFPSSRDRQQPYPSDVILETGTLLSLIAEHDFA
jgi:hypothetical protein